MDKRKSKKWLSVALAMAFAGGLVSCSTESIDLGDIDTTLGWELKDFKLPGNNSTHEMVMQEVFDIDTTGCIKINPVTGDYYFTKKGDHVEPSSTEVEPISVTTNQQDIHPNPFRISAEQLGLNIPMLARAGAPSLRELAHTIQVFDVYETDLAGDIVRLDQATTDDALLTLTVHFSADLAIVIDEIASLSFSLPPYFSLGDVTVKQNGRLRQKDSNNIEFEGIKTSDDFIFTVTVNALDFTVCQDTGAAEYLVYRRLPNGNDGYKGEVEMKGQVDVTARFDTSRVTTDITKLRPGMEFVINSELDIQPISISSATGEFRPSFDFEVGRTSIGDVPSLLDDPDTKVKLHNLIIRFDVESSLGLTGIVDGDLISNFKDNSSRKITVHNIEVLPETTSHIVICRQQPSAGEYPGCQVFYTGHPDMEGDVQDLVDAIPESVEFQSTATTKAGETGTIYLGRTYTFAPSYEMEALLALDRGSVIVYRDTLDGWAEDLKDIELAAGATVTIEAEVVNSSPLSYDLEVTATDANHQGLTSEMDVTVTTAAGGNTVPAEGRTHLTIVVKQNTDGAFRKLDGIVTKAIAHGDVEGVTVNSGTGTNSAAKQTLRLSNIGATLTGKVIAKIDD